MQNAMTHHDDKTMGCCDAMAHLADAMCACCCQEECCETSEQTSACCEAKDAILAAMKACLACIETCCGPSKPPNGATPLDPEIKKRKR